MSNDRCITSILLRKRYSQGQLLMLSTLEDLKGKTSTDFREVLQSHVSCEPLILDIKST